MITETHVNKLLAQGKIFYKLQGCDISWEHEEGHLTAFFDNFNIAVVYSSIEELNNTLNAVLTEHYRSLLFKAISEI